MQREFCFVLTLEQDSSNEAWQRSVKKYMEDTGKSAYEFEEEMRKMFKDSLQNHLQGELGGEGITVTIDDYEE